MSPLGSLVAFVLALCGFYATIKWYNNKRKKPTGSVVPLPTPTPLPVVEGVTIGRRTYGLPVDGIYVNVLRVDNGTVYYTFDTGPDSPLIDQRVEDFLKDFIPIVHSYRPPFRKPVETQPK